jgi:hypothetical protein
MSNQPISMHKLRQVIRWLLSVAEVLYGQGKGSKSINSMLGVSRNTIKKYLHIFHLSGMSYEQFFSMSDHDGSTTVMKNGYVRLSKDVHYYSVPYHHIGKKVKILYGAGDVEVYFRPRTHRQTPA